MIERLRRQPERELVVRIDPELLRQIVQHDFPHEQVVLLGIHELRDALDPPDPTLDRYIRLFHQP